MAYHFAILEQILLYKKSERMLYQGSFIMIDQYFSRLGERRERRKVLSIFLNLQSGSFLIACYILYPVPDLGNKGNH